MFDGAAAATASTVNTEQTAQNQAEAADHATTADTVPDAPTGEAPTTADQTLFDALAVLDASVARQEIVFLSSSVRDYQQLLDGISPNVEVYVLDPARDGVAQMAEILAGRTGVDAIHLIGEGTEAEMHLGASFLTQESISRDYAEQFGQIGQSLSADADLLIYGCNFGHGEAGQLAMNMLADLTGADVAASTDRTGHVAEYANWQLEVSTGSIETAVVISASTQASWEHAMATFTVTSANDTGAGSLRTAITNANAAAGTDTIVFNIAGAGLHTINLTSALPTITGRVTIDAYTETGASVNTLAIGNDAVLLIELNGTGAGSANGLVLGAGSDGSTIRGLVINRFSLSGIQVNSTNNLIVGNWIGVDATGTLDRGNTVDGITISANNNTIGTLAAADRNVLSGNNDEGVDVDPGVTGVVIQGNYIGTNVTGTAAVPNGLASDPDSGGARLDGNGIIFRNNLVSGNLNWGVYVTGTGNVLHGNQIGTDAAGTAALANSGPGIRIAGGSNHVIGGVNAGEGNTIAYNTGNGIQIESATSMGIAILGNSIFGNSGLGIDLANNGVTVNDAGDGDTGTNNLQNFPVLTSVQMSSTQATIVGTLNSTANTNFRIEFFSSATQDATGYGEGQTHLGFVNVTTDGSGNASFNTTLAVTGSEGGFISATATRSNATFTTFTDTSEFAQNTAAVFSAIVDLNSGPTIVTAGPVVVSTTSTTDLVSSGNFGTTASATPPAPWVESGTGGNGRVVLAAGDGRYNWTAGNATGTTISQALTVPASTSNSTVMTTNTTATSTTVETTTVTTVDAITSISFGMAWQNADVTASNNDNRLIISYNGVTYATFETFERGTANAAGLVGTWTYSNGASGPATTLSVTNEATGALTPITIDLPAGVTVSGALQFRYTSGSTGNGSDDLAIDNVVAISTKTTTTTLTTVTTTSDTADNNWTATFTENGSAVSIADTDSSIFDSDSANIVSAAITLTNPATGDRLLVSGSAAASGTLVSGITWTRTDTTVTLSGVFTKAQYADAIELIQFENTTDTPSTTPRTIAVTVNDGTSDSNTAIATINVVAVNDPPVITSDGGGATASVSIAENSTAVTTVTATDPDSSALTFSITGGADASLFTIDSSSGQLSFITAPNFEAPVDLGADNVYEVVVQASDGTATDTQTILVTVTDVNEAPVATDATVTLAENTATGTSVHTVGATDPDAGATLTYSITGGNGLGGFTIDASTGEITVANSAVLDYENVSSFTLTVDVSDGANTDTATITINLTDVNEAPVLAANTGSTVVQGGPTFITTAELQVTDVDSAPAQLIYTVTVGPANGQLELVAAPGVSINSFTQAQIDSGQVVYVHNGSFTASDSFLFTVSDGAGGSIGATTFGITVTSVNSAPSLDTNAGSTVVQGLTDLITSGELHVTDTDNAPAQLTYTVTIAPLNGRLELTTAPGVTINSFTQADVNAGRLVFVHSGAVSTSDSFTFTVSDGVGGTIGASTFNFTVTPFVPPPPLPPGPGPVPVPVPVPIPVPGLPGPVPGVVVQPVAPPSVLIGTMTSIDGAMSTVGASDDPAPRAALPSRTFARVEQSDVVLEEPKALPMEPLSLPVKKMLVVGHKLAERLTRLADDLERAVQERESQAHLVGRVASFSGIALSAGFVAWILRGGSLLASFLVSMPAWRHFDPLPVLGMNKQDRRRRDRKAHEEHEQENKQFRGLGRVLKSSSTPAKQQGPGRAKRPKS